MSIPDNPRLVPESSGAMTTKRESTLSWTQPDAQTITGVWVSTSPTAKRLRPLRIDRAYTDAKVILILCGASSIGILSVAGALWLAHRITR